MPIGIYQHKKGWKHTEKTKQKIKEKRVKQIMPKGRLHPRWGKSLSEETKEKIIKATKGEKNHFWGKHHSEKTKEKIKIKSLGKHHSLNTEFKKGDIRLLGKKFTEEHKRKIGEAQSGEKSYLFGKRGIETPNWKGGITPESERIRKSLEYKLWRKSVFERDNFICQKYGTKGGELKAHHINNFADFPELRTSINNGITLSEKAHKEFHKKYGNKNNTREQLEEFLNPK